MSQPIIDFHKGELRAFYIKAGRTPNYCKCYMCRTIIKSPCSASIISKGRPKLRLHMSCIVQMWDTMEQFVEELEKRDNPPLTGEKETKCPK